LRRVRHGEVAFGLFGLSAITYKIIPLSNI
jgi:hypothetical protein